MSQQSKKVIISSTARDLPEHRKEVTDACLRQSMLPKMMEQLPASDAEAIAASLAMVDEAEIYVGVFAHRYGYVPKENNPQQISVTEMEYNRAVERKIPRLIFLIDKDHPIKIEDVEVETSAKLKAFKERLQTTNIVNYFKSPADLRAHVINSLSQLREPDLTTFHYISDIPAPPEPFIAHPYTLLQAHRLVGRQKELNLLTDWVTKQQEQIYGARILSIVAIGGMGKSALTWKWFNDIAPQEMKPLAGRMWWSFYESDATFENFITRALAYVTRRKLDEVQKIPSPEREAQLLAALDREPFLIVLDGLERILIAYARMDAAFLQDKQVDNKKNLRKTADPRVGRFLKKLAQVKNSHILISSRLYPAELETDGGDPIPGSFRHDIQGMTDEDAVELWRAFGTTGSRDELLPVFTTFDKHPLLIQALAGEIKRYHRAPGNFQEWRKANSRFEPSKFPRMQEAMTHVLEFALSGLDDKSCHVLQTIAAFRMPAHYDTLAALLTGEDKARADEHELDTVLTELEDRGLIGWDKRANRYDLHPIVRGVVWSGLGNDTRHIVYVTLHTHFVSFPTIDDWREINSIEELTPAIELYNTLIGLERYDDAFIVFQDRLYDATIYRFNASRQGAELLEMLFTDGLDQLPRVSQPLAQAFTLGALAQAYQLSGEPKRAVPLFIRSNEIQKKEGDMESVGTVLCNLSDILRLSGSLHESEDYACRALVSGRELGDDLREVVSLYSLGLMLAVRGIDLESAIALNRSLLVAERTFIHPPYDYQAMRALWFGDFYSARNCSDKALTFCDRLRFERGIILATRLQGEAALGLSIFTLADECLHHSLTRARAGNLVEEELPSLVALAELRRRQGDLKAAREFLDDVWEPAERGPYTLFHADASNVLAQIERDAGNTAEAIEAAENAYRLAWCDGPPFAYHWGLIAARKHFQELGAAEPDMPPFDQSKFEPMPDVEIDPEDEFHVEESSDN
jgi:tetratricopeptide (TPR) repeat protein